MLHDRLDYPVKILIWRIVTLKVFSVDRVLVPEW